LLEFAIFVVGLALIASSLYVRFRDIGQIWDVLAMVMLYTSAIMYPMAILPQWLQSIVGLNPLVQVTQGIRRALFSSNPPAQAQVIIPQPAIYGVLIALALLAVGYWLHRREAPRFPEVA
jgi:ABC-2 type transport system permease protein